MINRDTVACNKHINLVSFFFFPFRLKHGSRTKETKEKTKNEVNVLTE